MERDEVVGLGDRPVVGRIAFAPTSAGGPAPPTGIVTAETQVLRAQNAALKELIQRFVATHNDLPGSQGEPCRCECCQEAITLTSPRGIGR